MKRVGIWAVGLVVAGLVTASCAAPAGEPEAAAIAADDASAAATVASVRAIHDTVKTYVTATAEQVSEDLYSFQPTDEVRTMGALLGHIADASLFFCNGASGLEMPDIGNAEEMTSKAELQQALADAFAFCDSAFDAVDANADEAVDFFNAEHSRVGVLAFNNAHNYEHYGNLVTYMRINGMVPPSTQDSGGN